MVVTIYDDRQRIVRRYASDDPAPPPIPDLDKPAYWERPFRRPAPVQGMHRFVWDLREPAPLSPARDLPISAVPHDTPPVPEGALVVPGNYVVELDVDGTTTRQPLVVAMDPRVSMTPAALASQYGLAHTLTSIMDRSFRDSGAAKTAGHAKAADEFGSINEAAAFLLDTIDGADAPPTSQADAAVVTLAGRLEKAERQPPH